MPLPNADPDKRMYKLLKNIDLENLSFAQFQSTAQTVFAEPEAEDTLRRIVLINLARMSVAGDWNGLTTSGGGANSIQLMESFTGAAGEMLYRTPAMIWSNDNTALSLTAGIYLWQWIASDDKVVDALALQVSTASAGEAYIVGIYSTNSNGTPNALLTQGTIVTDSTGFIVQTSLTGSLTLSKGSTYFMSYIVPSTSPRCDMLRRNDGASPVDIPNTLITNPIEMCFFDAGITSLPATITLANIDPVAADLLNVAVRLAA